MSIAIEEDLVNEFTGIWLPPHVLNLFWNHKITKIDLAVLCTVESSVEDGGEGCTDTNLELAAQTNTSPKRIKESVERLIKKGLLIRKIIKGVRELETIWSRPLSRRK